MRKVNFFLVLFLTCNFFLGLSQSQSDEDFAGKALYPTSPEASKLGNFGNIPLNSSTGQMTFSVPIHEISIEGKSWPIQLNYNYSGLKLDEKPSLSGLGWLLTANGVINREVRGLPDESSNGYYGNPFARDKVYAYVNGGKEAVSIPDIYHILEGRLDTEADKYTVSIPGIHFTFKIGLDQKPVFLTKKPKYKLDIQWETYFTNETHEIKSFTVTDDSGIKYVFSSIETSTPSRDEELLLNPRVSWNLTNIIYTNGQEIKFNYISNTITNYTYEAKGKTVVKNPDESINAWYVYDINPHPLDSPMPLEGYEERHYKNTIKRKILSSISFPGGIINLTTTSNSDNKFLYKSIQVKDNSGNIINYKLEYSGKRDVLTSIKKNNKTYYNFEYYGQENSNLYNVPDFYDSSPTSPPPLSQDRWGYYNGAPNQYLINIPFREYKANREPDLFYSRLGAMKKIIYPTGGHTEIDYELNTIKIENNFENYKDVPMSSFERIISLNPNWDFSQPSTKEVRKIITIKDTIVRNLRQKISGGGTHTQVDMKISRIDENGFAEKCPYEEYYSSISEYGIPEPEGWDGSNYYNYANTLLEFINQSSNPSHPLYICPELYYSYFPYDRNLEPYEVNNNKNAMIFIPGTYEFVIRTELAAYLDEVIAEFGLREQIPLDSIPKYINTPKGGLRVSSLKDCTNNKIGNQCNTRTFNYNDESGLSTGVLNVVPIGPKKFTRRIKYRLPNGDGYQTYSEAHVFSSSNELYTSSSSSLPVYYTSIIESNPSNNGYIKRNYLQPGENRTPIYPVVPKGENLSKGGNMVSTSVYKENTNTGEPKVLTNHTKYNLNQVRDLYMLNYEAHIDENHPWSFKIEYAKDGFLDWTKFSYDEYPNPDDAELIAENLKLYEFKKYKELDSYFIKTEEEITQYFDEQQTSQKIRYHYNPFLHLKSKSTTSSTERVLNTHFYYPYDISSPIYDHMVTKNQIARPVLTKVFKDEVLLSEQKTDFTLVGNGYKPSLISLKKGGGILEPRIGYVYDNLGNIIEEHKIINNTKFPTSFIWGCNPKKNVVAKIESKAYADVNLNGVDFATICNNNVPDSDKNIELDKIRTLNNNALVTTYTHKGMIGLSSITNPNGNSMYYEYDDLYRLQYVKDKDYNILEAYNYNYRADPLTASLVNNNAHTVVGYNYPFSVIVTGGTGDYSYHWTVSNSQLNQILSATSTSINLDITNAHLSSFVLTCVVTDNITNQSTTVSKTIPVKSSYPSITLGSISSDNLYKVGTSVTFSVNVSGGTGNYLHEWSIEYTDGRTRPFVITDTPTYTIPILSAMCPGIKIIYKVTDVNTNQVVIVTKNINLSNCEDVYDGGINK